MQPLHHFAYISTLSPTVGPGCVIDVVRSARIRNRDLAVTGVLIFDGWAFFQYLEGPTTSIDSVVASIYRDRRHVGISPLAHGPVDGPRRFGDWAMAYAIADDETLLPAIAERRGVRLADDLERLIPRLDLVA